MQFRMLSLILCYLGVLSFIAAENSHLGKYESSPSLRSSDYKPPVTVSVPTTTPSQYPTYKPTVNEDNVKTVRPTQSIITSLPSLKPTLKPSLTQSTSPTVNPSLKPSLRPTTQVPTKLPTLAPTSSPTTYPTFVSYSSLSINTTIALSQVVTSTLDTTTKTSICSLLKTIVCIKAMKLPSTSYCHCDTTNTYFTVLSSSTNNNPSSPEENDSERVVKTIATAGTKKYTLLTNVHTFVTLEDFPALQDHSEKLSVKLNSTVHAYFQNTTAVTSLITSLKEINPTAFATSAYVSYTTSTAVTPAATSTDSSGDTNKSSSWYSTNQDMLTFAVIVTAFVVFVCFGGCAIYCCCCKKSTKSIEEDDEEGDPITTNAQYVMYSTHTHVEVNSGHDEQSPSAPPFYEVVQVATITSPEKESAVQQQHDCRIVPCSTVIATTAVLVKL